MLQNWTSKLIWADLSKHPSQHANKWFPYKWLAPSFKDVDLRAGESSQLLKVIILKINVETV